jgi:hypothetical protein
VPIADTDKSRAQLSDAVAITRSFSVQLKRRGIELRLIVGNHSRSVATGDLPLLKAVTRAHRWFVVCWHRCCLRTVNQSWSLDCRLGTPN